MTKNKTLFLDMKDVPLTEAGITDFYWPINADEMHEVYIQTLHALILNIREMQAADLNGVDAVLILYISFLSEVMSLYEASQFLLQSEKDNVSWNKTEINPWVTVLKENKSLEASFIIRRLNKAPVNSAKHRLPLRYIRDLLVSRNEGMIRRSLRPCNYDKDIVSLTLNPLAIQRAKKTSDRIYYQRDEFWFKNPNNVPSFGIYSEIIEKVVNCVCSTLNNPPEKLRQYFREWWEVAIPLVDAYMLQLQKKNECRSVCGWVQQDICGREF